MNIPSSVFGRGGENELRLVNEKGEQIHCLQNIENPSVQVITRPIVLEIRNILESSNFYASKEDAEKRIKPELDTQQFELISKVHRNHDSLIQETEDLLGYLEHELQKRYGTAVSLDQSVSVPTFATYAPTTSTILNALHPGLIDNESTQRYAEADILLTQKNVREHTNILGRHTNISFRSKEIAETFFRTLNAKVEEVIRNTFSTFPNTNNKRFESYKKVCNAIGQQSLTLDPEAAIFDKNGSIPFSYHLVRFKEFSPGVYGVELRLSDAITSSDNVRSRIQEELRLLFS